MNASAPRILSCGILIESPKGWLLAHATHTTRWDLPKGRCELGETAKDAAMRETMEETGIDVRDHEHFLEDLGAHPYIPKKDLHLFRLRVNEAFDLSRCQCSTYVDATRGGHFLETDRWAWVPVDQLRDYLGKGLIKYLEALDILDPNEGQPMFAATGSKAAP